ncbi:GlsB/YeaQ/YmgE family stress response membrane protein [Halomonas stenophila]|uniref:Putative membrane protein YeaQ/YmgE (Transglycosylase-associated protein family) n=1 Tax=Halomonas stenophila TaxID=795312 RepID=A0A7W5EUJ5_9GAMM|nr:GlsB/YeaQ/YmgE family stress response membrane protein [Halomonas stenophila]MBB3231045.1 putative membrane protein YeaQ/YmgE (transglycosylase-associated protein family) [Halomonas stenophila]
MGILSWILFGLIAGVIAKWIMPGKDPGGIIVTILIGIAGAFVGGWLGSMVGMGSMGDFSLGSFITAIVGALVLLGGYRMLKKA